MSAKSIVQEVFSIMNGEKTAKSIVQDAIGLSGIAIDGQQESHSDEEAKPKVQVIQQGNQKVITFSFTLDPQMIEKFGKAMPKGAKPDDRGDVLDPNGGDSPSQQQTPDEVATNQIGEQKDTAGDAVLEENPTDDKGSDWQKPNETVRESPKEDGSDDNQDDDDDEESRDKSVDDDDPQATPTAQDEAIACDGRHTDTPIENCRAEDPMFCPYHGAQKMTSLLQEAIANRVKQHNLTPQQSQAIQSSVTKDGPSSFKMTVTYPVSTSSAVEKSIEDGVLDFLNSKGIQVNDKPSASLRPGGLPTITSTLNTQSLKDRLPQGSTQADYDVAKAKQDIGIFNEWMDDLIEDFGDPNSDIEPTDLENLMNMQMGLEDLVNQAASGNQQAASQFKSDKKGFEDFYHDVRGIADLPQVQTVQDAEKMRDDLAGNRHKAGDWWNAKEEITDIRKQLGLLSSSGRALPMKTIQTKYPSLFASWDKYKTKYENLFVGSLAKILGNGKTDFGANGKFEDGQKNGDLRKMKGALHTLKYATEEYCDLMPAFMKAMQDHKGELLQYAQQKGVPITPYVMSSALTPSVQTIQAALNGVPRGVVSNVTQNQNGEHFIEFASGNSNYAQSLIPLLRKKYPNSTVSFVSGTANNNGMDYIKIV